MKCINPIAIRDTRDYETELSNGYLFLPCGKCEACRNNDALQWRIRLKEEFYNSDNAFFVTLTYDDSTLNFKQCFNNDAFVGWFPSVDKYDVQKFFKRFRKSFESYYKTQEKKLSYFLVSEYGPSTFRPHYHCILFNVPTLSPIPEVNVVKVTEKIQQIWNLGFVKVDKCNENRIAYCTKYMSCMTIIPPYLPKCFRLISKGLGRCYTEKLSRVNWHKNNLANYYPDKNYKCRLPRYYKDKIFNEDEKLMLSQLSQERQFNEIRENRKNFVTQSERDFMDTKTSIEKYKRDYKKKSLKNRKDL